MFIIVSEVHVLNCEAEEVEKGKSVHMWNFSLDVEMQM